MSNYIRIKLNSKHEYLLQRFKKAIIDLEGSYYGYLGDYVAEAIEFYMHYMKNFPEKIGKERYTNSNLSKIEKRIRKFYDFIGEETIKTINNNGINNIVFDNLLKACFVKSEKTLREYKKEILMKSNWSEIKIVGTSKRIILGRYSPLYEYLQRFDITLGNYYPGIKPTKEEKAVLNQLKSRFIPGYKKENKERIDKELEDLFGGDIL